MALTKNVWVVVWLVATIGCHARNGEESEYGPAVNVTAVMESEILLPCDVSTTEEDDQPVLIMFYTNGTGTPIYTVDLRNRPTTKAKHLPLSQLKGRAKFELKPGQSGLKLQTVWSSDDGLYRCRVDFRKSPTRNSRIYLTVIVPPDSVRIVDRNGNEKSSTIGPYVLGQTLTLKCVATGGRPPPKLTWYAGHKDVRGQISENKGEVVNTLSVPSLQRHHLDQSFICQATNADLAVPVTAAVTVDMTLPPMSIKLMGIDGPLSAGVGVTVICQVIGARPNPIVSWWLDARPLSSTGERVRDGGNVTENQVVLTPSAEDEGRYLSCRAETPGLLQSQLEDGVKLRIHYVPKVKISLDPRLNIHEIKEGDDVPFTCTIKALPPPTSVSWYHNEIHLNPNTTGGVIVSNQSLVLQHVNRYSSGAYTCRATNSEGQGQSRPVILDVKYSPQCKSGQRWVYGIATQEMVHVSCQVEAHPSRVNFQWVFNNSVQITEIAKAHITNNHTHSMLTYTPITKMDYGFLLCWAENAVGKQHDPCVFRIFPAGPPEKLKNCSVVNETKDSVQVKCEQGFDGGLPQSFVMEVYGTQGRNLKSNMTKKRAEFSVDGLPSGLPLTIKIYAVNSKGRSEAILLKAATLHDIPKKGEISGVIAASELPSTMELYPSLAVILGVVGGIIVVFAVIVVVMVVRRPRRENAPVRLHQDDSSQHILKKDDSHSGRLDLDEKDPDVIPETRGSRADLMECRVVADVSTLYGEMVAGNQQETASPPPCAQHSNGEPTPPPPPPAHANVYVESSHVTHAHVKPVDTHVESQPHAAHHHSQYIQQDYPPPHLPSPPPPPVDIHHSTSYHHMAPQTPTTCPPPTYTLAQAMPVSHTQTLPHPRSNHGRGYNAHQATLQRRSSLYMDPMVPAMAPPIAPPPAYGSPTVSMAPDMMGVVPMVSETVCITPNNPIHAHINPPEQYPPKPFPSSFSSDRMESAV